VRRQIGLAVGALALVLALVLGVIAILGETQRHGAHETEEAKAPPVREVTAGGVRLTVDVQPPAGKVGELVQITGRLVDAATGEAVRNVRYQLVAWHLEDDVPVFRTTIGSADGTFAWRHQFWDGTEHEIRVIATPGEGTTRQFAPLTLRRAIAVEAVPPPLFVQLRALVYLLVVTAVGLVIGIQIGLRTGRRSAVSPRAAQA
jgi:hypothetical protein